MNSRFARLRLLFGGAFFLFAGVDLVVFLTGGLFFRGHVAYLMI